MFKYDREDRRDYKADWQEFIAEGLGEDESDKNCEFFIKSLSYRDYFLVFVYHHNIN